ncbi:hypothetical protein EJ08DRAFT_666701 [Tothia fuscella]|uniref:Uncharacterized protein n=1 Tax=Tothia fuscella TaxID=1048955 RepID=A0A9P4TSH3_9PEZI|nr:hypothetical protein EJ08DRAFT_666701 [Tothia fuscella]
MRGNSNGPEHILKIAASTAGPTAHNQSDVRRSLMPRTSGELQLALQDLRNLTNCPPEQLITLQIDVFRSSRIQERTSPIPRLTQQNLLDLSNCFGEQLIGLQIGSRRSYRIQLQPRRLYTSRTAFDNWWSEISTHAPHDLRAMQQSRILSHPTPNRAAIEE